MPPDDSLELFPPSAERSEREDPGVRGVDPHAPLADRMRPRTLDEVVGQDSLLGPGGALRTPSGRARASRRCRPSRPA